MINRDIKPANFVMGRNDDKFIVHMIDFGCAKKYIDPETNRHIRYTDISFFKGVSKLVIFQCIRYILNPCKTCH